jgi:hypothetical protein
MSELELEHLRNIRKIIYPIDLNENMISLGSVACFYTKKRLDHKIFFILILHCNIIIIKFKYSL